jgi:hypothetical protein
MTTGRINQITILRTKSSVLLLIASVRVRKDKNAIQIALFVSPVDGR